MTPELFERIRDEDMIHVRADGAISYDSRLERMLDADALEMLLQIAGDHVTDGEEGEIVDWHGAKGDCREAGLL